MSAEKNRTEPNRTEKKDGAQKVSDSIRTVFNEEYYFMDKYPAIAYSERLILSDLKSHIVR